MKIRWTSTSVRLRITPQELAQLQHGKSLRESFTLPNSMGWEIRVVPSEETQLSTKQGEVVVTVSPRDIVELSDDSKEGVYFSEGELRYYIEKDFPCAHPRAGEAEEPTTETFSAPPDFEARKNA